MITKEQKSKITTIMRNRIFNIFLAIVCFTIAFFTVSGATQTIIHFEGIANEMGFFMVAIILGVIFIISAFNKKG